MVTPKFKTINGWTKEKMIEEVRKRIYKGPSLRRVITPYVLGDGSGDERDVYHTICSYRGDDGNKCGVGIFIPDDLYKSNMESKSVLGLLQDNSTLQNKMPLETKHMQALQIVHDRSNFSDNVTEKLVNWIEENVENQ